MHVFFQLAVTGIVLFSGILAISIKQKRINIRLIAMLALILALSFGLTYFGFKTQSENTQERLVKAGTLASYNRIDDALDVLKKSGPQSIHDQQLNLFKARLYLLNNSPRVAAYYYARIEASPETVKQLPGMSDEAIEEELEAFHEYYLESPNALGEAAFRDYLVEAGLSPDAYGLVNVDVADSKIPDAQTSDDLEKIVRLALFDDVDAMTSMDPLLELAYEKTALSAKFQKMTDEGLTVYTEVLPDGTNRDTSLEELIDEGMELYDQDSSDEAFNLALIQGSMLASDFETARDILVEMPVAQNLAILSELVISGCIEDSDVAQLVDTLPEEAYDAILDQYENLYDRTNDKELTEEAELIADRMEALQTESEHPVLAGLLEAIDKKISGKEKDQSHLNLELSKISLFLNNEVMADAYIDKAMENMEAITNEGVVEGLGALSSIAGQANESFDELKKIPDEVKELSSSILPVKLPPEAQAASTSFENHAAGYFTRKAVEVSVTQIDTSHYPDIKAYVQFGLDSGEEIDQSIDKKDLVIFDTNQTLSDYVLEKIKLSRSNIILCVDVSPSMENFLSDLKTACHSFMAGMGKNERVGIVAFDSGIVSEFDFDTHKDTLDANIDSLGLGDGTNIHQAVVQSLSKFNPKEGESNIVIVLSDGANNNPVSPEEMNYVSELCLKNGATVFTIGLGEGVDGNYLSELAKKGNGRFLFAPSSNQLEAFYELLHHQIRNQYKLSYKAPQPEILDRKLEVSLPERQAKGVKSYSLVSNKEMTDEEQAALIELMEQTGGLYAKGLDKRCLVKGQHTRQEVNLIGGGFSSLADSDIEMTLEGYGPIKKDRVHIIDNEHIGLTLPENLPAGTYSLKVKLKDRAFDFTDELQILKSGQVQTIDFGPYHLSANVIKDQGNGQTLLQGNVQINNFLRFKGDLILEGDYEDEHYLKLIPKSASFIAFRKGTSPNVLVDQVFLKYQLNLDLNKWQPFSLSRDGTPVEIDLPALLDMGLIEVPAPRVVFNPDNVELLTNNVNFDLPMQKYIFLAAGAKPIKFKGDSKILVTAEQIALAGNFTLESEGNLVSKRILNILELKKMAASVDTMKGDFSFEVGVGLAFWRSEDNQISLKLGWKSCCFDEFQMGLPWSLNILKTPVPVTVKELTGGVSNLSLSATDGWDKLSKLKYMLQTDILVAKATEVLPFLSNIGWLKDKIPGLLLIDDAKATLTFEKFALTFDAKLKLFEEFDVGAVELAVGHYEYKNSLLNMGPQETVGIHLKNARGIDLDFDKLKLKFQQAVGVDANKLGMFLQTTGVASASIDLWGFERECSFDGDALIAVHQSNSGTQFTIGLRGRDIANGNASDFRFYVNGDKIAVVGIDIPFTEKSVIEISL